METRKCSCECVCVLLGRERERGRKRPLSLGFERNHGAKSGPVITPAELSVIRRLHACSSHTDGKPWKSY